ncbi:MAG: right-handed parallel beta-helix repeat-containing protein, partial [Anaerolineae bacterium]|nr:right-handed parallel beta-helix repeat-containing protein [Anaerolineae bacterium]
SFFLIVVGILGAGLLGISTPTYAGGREFIVTSAADSGNGTLRQAILDMNRLGFTVDNPAIIRFQIDAPRPYEIVLQSALPEITTPVIIDGEAQCATENSASEMRVMLDGAAVPAGDGLLLAGGADNSQIMGLSIINFVDGAGIFVNGANNVAITCNHIGVDAEGTSAGPNDIGIYSESADLITIGDEFMSARNVISGNLRYGIRVDNPANVIGNFVGIDATGVRPIANDLSGIFIESVAHVANNIVSGNGEMGILIDGAESVTVVGNLVGTGMTGSEAIPNGLSGVYVRDSVSIIIEGGNVLSGNTEMGILIRSSNAVAVRQNYIGTDPRGSFAVPNGFSGVGVSAGSFDVTIGGQLGVDSNIISGNTQIGIRISDEGTRNVLVIGNFIGTDPTGTYAIPNMLSGVYMREGAIDNIIGTGIYNERNIISGNGQSGVVMNSSNGNTVRGNFIGTDMNGTYAIPNAFSGISLEDAAADNLIGGDFAGAGNLISGNTELGIYLTDVGTDNNRIIGNFIGVDITGTYAIGNGFSGIGIFGGATNTVVGGVGVSERNLISGNGQFGIAINGEESRGLVVVNNYIGTDYNGTVALPNLFGGIVVERGARDVIIGGDTPEARNVISGNSFSGVSVRNESSGDVTILSNFIGSDSSGQLPLPNAVNGVRINDLAANVRVGDVERGTGNLIAFNTSHGVYVDAVTDVVIEGNAILTNGGAGVYLPNGDMGVTLGRNDFKRNCENPPSDMSACEDVVGE